MVLNLMHESISIALEAALISSRINGHQMVKRLIWNFEGKDFIDQDLRKIICMTNLLNGMWEKCLGYSEKY